MRPSKNLTLIFILTIILAGCNTGKKALQRGDYYEATIQSVKFLRSNPDSEKAMETIMQSYPLALDYYRQKVDEISISNSPDKYLSIVEIYTKLNNLADEISRCPAALNAVKPVVYFHDQLNKAQELAIAEQYNTGVQLLKSGYIEDARSAVQKFEWVVRTRPGYSDVDRKLEEALELATFKVVIERIPYMDDQYQANLNRFYDKLSVDLAKNGKKRFVRFFNQAEAEELKIVPHQVVKMQFVDFSVGNIYEKETEKEYVSDTLVIGTFKDDKGVSHDVKGTVKAKANIHERDIVSKGILEVKIIDYQTNSVVENKRFPGEYVWRNDWANFNGDERALPQKIKAMTKEKQVMPPLPQDLFVFFSDPLGSSTSSFLKSYYRNK
jgi:hypothetical protein